MKIYIVTDNKTLKTRLNRNNILRFHEMLFFVFLLGSALKWDYMPNQIFFNGKA